MRYFLTIAEEGQITAAARKLHIAQPPLSYQLGLLERELGVPLVRRGPRGIELTEAGKLLYKRAEQMLSMAASARREIENYGRGVAGTLSVGTISSAAGLVPNRAMLEFVQYYPEVRFEIHEGNTFSVIEMLEKGIVELGIVRTPFPSGGLICRYFEAEPMVAVMTERNVCGAMPDAVTLQELADRPLILYRRFEALICGAFAGIGREPFVCCKNDDARTTLSWAKTGFGVGIVPRSALLTMISNPLICKEIRCEELRTQFAVIRPKNRSLSPLAEWFVELFGRQE